MDDRQIISILDHTLLKPSATLAETLQVCREAWEWSTASACIAPCFVAPAAAAFPQLNLCTVVGFPLGFAATEVKIAEARAAVAAGAREIDMVIRFSWVRERQYDRIAGEIAAVKQAIGPAILKVIIETCYWDEEEKTALCRAVAEGGGDYIKTSTGFGPAGAELADIALFKRCLPPQVKIKAAGGIRTLEALRQFAAAGCHRIGSSNALALLAAKLQREGKKPGCR
ncbi:MAG: deoxyribose-phosphate aldolase [Firmicutes bacterium]|nr:deoxyribose-phosphate aldolase [Bacillota bacterium]